MSAALDQAKQIFSNAEAAFVEVLLAEAKAEVRRLVPNAASFDVEGDYDDDGDKRGRLLAVRDSDGVVIVDRDSYGENLDNDFDDLWDMVEIEVVDWLVTLAWDEYNNKTTIYIGMTP